VRSTPGTYPAVTALAALAGEVKGIVGATTKISYGADWTEYAAHVIDASAQEVRFPLDVLWASPSIDAVGVDYYAPLADWRGVAGERDAQLTDSPYRPSYLEGNLQGGEAMNGSMPTRSPAMHKYGPRSVMVSASHGYSVKK